MEPAECDEEDEKGQGGLGIDGPLPWEGGSYIVSGRRTYFDAMTKAAYELDMIETPFPYSFTDLHAKITQDVGRTGRLNVSGYLNDEGITVPRPTIYQTMDEAIAVLQEGPAAPAGTYVTIPEGYTVAQTVARIADPENGIEGFTAATVQAALDGGTHKSAYLPPDQASLEGTLYPETYRLEEGQNEDALVGQMVAQFDKVMGELDANGRAAALGRTPYEVLIVASMVEKEAQVPEERGKVARVIYNRLDEDMTLGIDATSCYAKGETPCTLTRSDLDSDSPYNTRNRKGLPPTPIASPGRASIEAALNPTPGDWLFYVLSDSEGRHTFAVTDDEFEAARQVCIERDLGCG